MHRPNSPLRALSAAPFRALPLVLAGALVAPASADRIYLADGKIVEDADVQSETVEKVVYTEGKGSGTKEVASELVLRVEFEPVPDLFNSAVVDTENESFVSAAASYRDYLANVPSKGDRKHPWAAAAAHYRLCQLGQYANDLDLMRSEVDVLKTDFADSRYVPMALALLADHATLNGDKARATAAIDELEAGAKEGRFPRRWDLEAQARRPLVEGSAKGESLERALASVAKDGAVFPTVVAFAQAARSESLSARGQHDDAVEALDEVLEAQGADARVLARAYAALGDSLYALGKARSESGDADGAKGLYERARLGYMRVVVSYPFEYGYVARSAVGAGLCFVALEDEDYQDNARSLFRFVRRKFKGTDWADQARKAENLL
ncbi:MAG: hypothetical protein AAFU73_08850 [Planctomycetota bacterium]